MKKYIAGIMCVLVLCCTGLAFGEGRDHGRGYSRNHGSRDGNSHGYYNNNHGNHHNGYYNNNHHNSWSFGFYTPAVAVITPLYPAYYPPVQQCRYINVFDAWGNYMGQERFCD